MAQCSAVVATLICISVVSTKKVLVLDQGGPFLENGGPCSLHRRSLFLTKEVFALDKRGPWSVARVERSLKLDLTQIFIDRTNRSVFLNPLYGLEGR